MKRYKVYITRTKHIVGECTAEYPKEALDKVRNFLKGEYNGNPAYMGDITTDESKEEQALVVDIERKKRVHTEEVIYEKDDHND